MLRWIFASPTAANQRWPYGKPVVAVAVAMRSAAFEWDVSTDGRCVAVAVAVVGPEAETVAAKREDAFVCRWNSVRTWDQQRIVRVVEGIAVAPVVAVAVAVVVVVAVMATVEMIRAEDAAVARLQHRTMAVQMAMATGFAVATVAAATVMYQLATCLWKCSYSTQCWHNS